MAYNYRDLLIKKVLKYNLYAGILSFMQLSIQYYQFMSINALLAYLNISYSSYVISNANRKDL